MQRSNAETRWTDVVCCDTDPEAVAPDDEAEWMPASLPFDAYAVLVAQGRIPHPYRDANADTLAWVGERTWWLRAHVEVDTVDEGAVLRLDGLDTVATISVNGVEAGRHANVFRPALLPVGRLLRPGRNEVRIRLDPPLRALEAPVESVATARRLAALFGRPAREDGHGMFGDLRMLRRRKPVLDWGWDFAPRLPSVGVADVQLVTPVRIAHVGFRTAAVEVVAGGADVVVSLVADAPGEAATVTLTAPDGRRHEASVVLDADGRADVRLRIDDARLWWTRDLGPQPLYDLLVRLGGEVVARRVGIRIVELDRSADGAGGRHFRFLVNGEPIFARGASVVPADLLGPAPERDRALVALAADGGMNMIRVWGGGGCGSDALYDAADELGVLIWQDFPFACADYPEDEGMLAEVAAEAEFQTRRLGAHASLALWCGNNEVHAMHQAARGDLGPGPWGHAYFHGILPEIVARESPGVAYWPGSPYGEDDPVGANGVHDGDRHAWEVWHGLPFGAESPETYSSHGEAAHFRRYRYDTGRFISEFGLIASPARDTLAHWISPDELHLDSEAFRSHLRDEPKDKALGILALETGLPSDLDEYVRFTQAVQAEGLVFGIEHYRRHEPHTAGTLVWQLNDPWPGISWSLIDHDLRQKPAYHRVRRAFAPVAASFRHTDDGCLELWIANSTAEPATLSLQVRVETLEGAALVAETVDAVAEPHRAARVWSLPAGTVDLRPDTVARVRDAASLVPANRLHFAPLRDIPFPEPRFTTDTRRVAVAGIEGAGLAVTITAETALYGATVSVADPAARFDDNVVDLAACESVTIVVSGAHDPEAGLRVEALPPRAAAVALTA